MTWPSGFSPPLWSFILDYATEEQLNPQPKRASLLSCSKNSNMLSRRPAGLVDYQWLHRATLLQGQPADGCICSNSSTATCITSRSAPRVSSVKPWDIMDCCTLSSKDGPYVDREICDFTKSPAQCPCACLSAFIWGKVKNTAFLSTVTSLCLEMLVSCNAQRAHPASHHQSAADQLWCLGETSAAVCLQTWDSKKNVTHCQSNN